MFQLTPADTADSVVTLNSYRKRCFRSRFSFACGSPVYVTRVGDDHAFVCQCCSVLFPLVCSWLVCFVCEHQWSLRVNKGGYIQRAPSEFMYSVNMREREELSRCFLPGQPAQISLPPPPPSPRAPGLDALHSLCKQIYPDQSNPLTVTAIVKYW